MQHVDDHLMARFLSDGLQGDARTEVEAHLAECSLCRDEFVEVTQILDSRPGQGRPWFPVLPLAAAAVLVLVWSGSYHPDSATPVTRDPTLTTTMAPTPLTPLGSVARVDELTWAGVPGADRYRLTLFSAEGEVMWQATPTDTSVTLPESVRLAARTSYYWRVKAETGYGRWVESDLVEFTLTLGRESR